MVTMELFKKNVFNPLNDKSSHLPNDFGIYFICIKDKATLPKQMLNLEFVSLDGYPVIYIGMSGKQGIRKRDYKNHFTGSARSSTLRKSLGSLFGFSRHIYDNKKYKYIPEDEKSLSKWMKENLLFVYYVINNGEIIDNIETSLIVEYHPPLNLDKNKSTINMQFRDSLSNLRKN